MDDLFIGASGSELEPSGSEPPRSGKGFEGGEVSEQWNATPDRGCLEDGG